MGSSLPLPSKSRLSSGFLLVLLLTGGAVAALSVPVAHAASEVTVGATTDAYGLGYAADGHTCGANGRFWVFYNDGTNWGWKSSADGVTWTSETTFTSAIPKPPTEISDIAFTCSGDTVYYAGGQVSSSDNHFYFNSGTLNSDGSISWGAEASQATQGYDVRSPSITLDSNGNVWVALLSDNTGATSYVEVWEKTSLGWTPAITPPPLSVAPIPQIIALTSGEMALLYGTGSSPISLETFAGGSWTAQPSTAYGYYNPQLSTAVAIGNSIYYCASDGGSVYFLSFSGGLWSSPSTISGGSSCSASTDGSSVIGLFYVTNSATIMYSQSNNGGSSFLPATTITGSDSGLVVVGASLAVSTNPAKQAVAVWLSDTPSTNSIKFASVSTSPVVGEQVKITDATPAPVGALATVSGCHASVSTIPMNGAVQTFGADPSCMLTITAPSDTLYTRYRFPGTSITWTYETGSSGTDVESNNVYYQYAITASYVLSGAGNPAAPSMTSTQTGVSIAPTLTTAPTVYWLDSGAAWSVPPTLTSGVTTWSTAPNSGAASGPTILAFVYAPPITSTTTSTSTTTTTATTTVIQTSTSTVTSPTTVTATVTSTTTAATATITTTVTTPTTTTITSTSTVTTPTTTTVTSTSTSVSTATKTSTVTQSTTLTSTTTTTTTATVTGQSAVPSSSSLTCDQARPQVNQRVNCTDVVSTADSGVAAGSIAWTSSGGGALTNVNCNPQNNGQQNNGGQLQCQVRYTPSSSGIQTLTATYAGDPYHSSSSGSAVLFVGSFGSSKVTSTSPTCDKTYLSVGQTTNCQAVVLAADGGPLSGTIAWTATDHGTFSHLNCGPAGPNALPGPNAQLNCSAQYTAGSTGAQVVTATYSGDASHLLSTGTFEVFVQSSNSALAQQAAILVPGGALAITGLSAVVLEARKGRESNARASHA